MERRKDYAGRLKRRIDDAKASHDGEWRGAYCTYNRPGAMAQVHCKGCGAVIRDLVPSEQHEHVMVHKNRTIVRERLVLACLPNYREVLFSADDGSAHVTCLCADCAERVKADETLREAIYAMDLEQWSREGAVHPSHIDRKLVDVQEVSNVIQ